MGYLYISMSAFGGRRNLQAVYRLVVCYGGGSELFFLNVRLANFGEAESILTFYLKQIR